MIQKAVLTAAGHHTPAAEHRAFPVQPQSADLLRRPMTAHTVLPQDRQHIMTEVDFGSGSEPTIFPQMPMSKTTAAQVLIPACTPPQITTHNSRSVFR